MPWVALTIFAAFAQTIRTALQKHLKASLSIASITWARSSFGIPVAIIYFLMARHWGPPAIILTPAFIAASFLAAMFQMIGTFLLVWLFSHTNFTISTLYAKTEVIPTAIIGAAFFGEQLSLLRVLAIIVSVCGVIILSIPSPIGDFRRLLTLLSYKTAIIGTLSGVCFAFGSFCIKQASYYLHVNQPLVSSATTLLTMVILQTIILGGYLLINERGQLAKMKQNIYPMMAIGFTAIMGSIGWFIAFEQTHVVYVKIVGQIECLFAIAITHYFFKERFRPTDIVGGIIVGLAIVLLIATL